VKGYSITIAIASVLNLRVWATPLPHEDSRPTKKYSRTDEVWNKYYLDASKLVCQTPKDLATDLLGYECFGKFILFFYKRNGGEGEGDTGELTIEQREKERLEM
jgi:hypothetical protein